MPGWLEALRRTYGYVPVAYTTTPPGAALANGMVLCRVYSRLTGRRIVSLPFSDHCDPLVEHAGDPECLMRALERDRVAERCAYLELRPRTALPTSAPALEPAQTFCLHTVDLTPGLEDIFRRLHKDSIQRKIRRAEREGVICEEGRGDTLLEQFYQLLFRTRRRQHLPPPPRAWFRNLVDCLGDQVKIRVASKEGQPIAGIVTLSFKNVLVYKYGGSDERFHNLGGMHHLLWSSIQEGKRNGVRELDLGRSDCDNTGLITFKDRWGAARSQLTYWRYPARLAPLTAPGWSTKVPSGILRHIPDSLVSAAWKTKVAKGIFPYIPDSLLIVAGKLLYKHVG